MQKPVGYLVNYQEGRSGEPGLFYDYILASNGLFIEAQNRLIEARIPVAKCEVRGLAPLDRKIVLTYGSIPQRFFDLALDTFLSDPETEHYVAITGVAGYHFYIPEQEKNPGKVRYYVGDSVVLDIHSHGHGSAWFSPQDNTDEKGLALYGVVGKLNAVPVVKLRIGVYGYFEPLAWADIFDGCLFGAQENEEKEVVPYRDIYSYLEPDEHRLTDSSRRLRWDRWFRR